jgi:hypothetical protein
MSSERLSDVVAMLTVEMVFELIKDGRSQWASLGELVRVM